jgi:transposase-like protein
VPRAKPQYPSQFKAEAIQLVRSSGSSISQIAKELGVSDNSLRNWVKQAQIDQGDTRHTYNTYTRYCGSGQTFVRIHIAPSRYALKH